MTKADQKPNSQATAAAKRAARLAEELRANLKRRKEKGRTEQPDAGAGSEEDDPARQGS